MIAGDIVVSRRLRLTGFFRSAARRARLRRRAARGDRRAPKARRSTSTAPRRSASAYRALDDAFGGYPHAIHYALKANSTLAIVAPAARRSAAPPTRTRSGRSRSPRAPASRRADIVFTGVGKSPAELECAVRARPEGDQRRIGRRARAHRGDRRARSGAPARVARPRQPRHRREEPSAHFDGPQDQQVRRADRRGARAARDAGRPAGAAAGRRARARRIADHDARAAAAAPRRSSRTLARELRDAGVALEYVDLGGGLGISYDGADVPTPRSTSARSSTKSAPTGLPIVARAGPRRSSGRPACCVARVIDVKPRTAASDFVVHRRRHDRADAAGALRRVPPHRAGAPERGGAARSTRSSARSARAATSSAATAMLPPLEVGDLRRHPRCRRVRRGDGVELQSPAAAGRSAGRRRRAGASSAAGRRVDDMLALE